ncbi:hypothetical protein D3C72_1690670 [compost metagenome]
MGVAGEGDVFRRGRELHGHAELTDHFADARADQVYAEYLVGLGVGQDFGEAFGLMVDLGPAVGGERELADFVLAAFGLELLFGLANAGQFRAGVDHPGNQVVVDLMGFTGNPLDAGHCFIFGLVREHRARGHVTDHPHAWH